MGAHGIAVGVGRRLACAMRGGRRGAAEDKAAPERLEVMRERAQRLVQKQKMKTKMCYGRW